MRYVTLESLTAGMVLAKPFYGENGVILLRESVELTERLLEKVRSLQYSGLYIEDEFSEGITAESVISEELRQKTAQSVRSLMVSMLGGSMSRAQTSMDDISELLGRIVDEISLSGQAFVNMADLKMFDMYTYQHSVNVCVLSSVIGVAMGMPRAELHDLATASMLHDLGKTFISKSILNKPGKLSPSEFEEMKNHPALGYNYMRKNFRFNREINASILQHHERFDGTGYPMGLAGNAILPYAQIISITDVYDAITSKRPYHEAILPSEAYEYILGNSAQHFNPEIVDVFIKKVAPFPLGMGVRLSNGQEGIVFKNYPEYLARPLVKLMPRSGQKNSDSYIDLLYDPGAKNITITGILI